MQRRLLIGVLAGLTMLVALPATASEHGLQIQADTAYSVNPDAGAVEVTTRFVVTNTLADKVTTTGRTRYYFESFFFPVPENVEGVTAVDGDGRQVEVVMKPPTGHVRIVTIQFPRLFFEKSIEIDVSYEIPGANPRSAVETRVNPAFAWFTAWAYGDPGLSTVVITVPEGFVVETLGSPIGDDLTAVAISEPPTWAAAISARRDDRLAQRFASYVDLRYWPGDEDWADFVGGIFSEGVPILADLIGQPWPEGDLEVVESYGPSLRGYAGWYLPAEAKIELGEELNPSVTLHEATHAWFNSRLFTDRWVNEGLAEVFARAALERMGSMPEAPGRPDDSQAFALNVWAPAEESPADPYGYAASHWVFFSIVEEVGFDGIETVLASSFAGSIPYPIVGREEVLDLPRDWRSLLDRLENLAGSSTAVDVFRAYVLTLEQAADLDLRTAARDQYGSFLVTAGGWGAPLEIRTAMSAWAFEDVSALIGEARDTLALRAEVELKATSLGASLPDGRELFEASSLATSRARFETQLEVVELVAAASERRLEEPALLESIGLFAMDTSVDRALATLSAGDLSTAERLAREVISVYDSARDKGIERTLAASALLSVLVGVGVGLRTIRDDA